MKSFSAQLRLHQNMLMNNGNLWGPVLFWVMTLMVNYWTFPQAFASSLAVLVIALFILFSWLVYSYINQFPLGMEKLLILKLRKQSRFYRSLIVYLLLIGILFTLLGLGVPAIAYSLHGTAFFSQNLSWWDWFSGFLMLYSVIPLAIAMGLFWQRRVMLNRRMAGVLTVVMIVLGACGEAIIGYWPAYLMIIGIFPPVSTIAQLFNTTNHLGFLDLALAWLMSLSYAVVLQLIDYVVLSRRKFLH